MTIECYLFLCPHHSFHEEGPDEGPFCYQDRCSVSTKYYEYAKEFQDAAIKNQETFKDALIVTIDTKDT